MFVILMGCNWLFSRVDVISFKYRIANKSPTPTPQPPPKKNLKKGKHKANTCTFFPEERAFIIFSH